MDLNIVMNELDNTPLRNSVRDILSHGMPVDNLVETLIIIVAEEFHEDVIKVVNKYPGRETISKKPFLTQLKEICQTKYGSEYSEVEDD